MAENTQTPPAALAMKDLIAEAGLSDRAYLKDYLEKPLDKETAISFLKKLDGAETLIGKKTVNGIPENWDDQKSVDEFFSKMRPESPDKYDYQFGDGADKDFVKLFKEASHGAGINNVQLKRQLDKIAPFFAERDAAAKAANDKRDQEFADLTKNMMGADFEKKSARVQAAVKELVPESARKFADKIDDKSLALFVAFADALLSKYAKEDDFADNTGGGGKAEDKNTLVEELKKLYAEPARNDFRHADHEKINKRINEILAHPALSK